ncbi:MAG: tetratricopeptide repeat protein [Candidatus Eiseniibacteriota bacterium]
MRVPLAAGVALITLVAYWPALRGGFVWDDRVLLDAEVLGEADGLRRIWLEPSSLDGHEDHYWPLVYTTFWLERMIRGGFDPAGMHLVNVLLHVANALLLGRLAARLGLRAAAATWIFALHPVHVESVAWIIERKDLLSAFLVLAAADSFLRFREGSGRGRWALSLVLVTAGMLSKSVAVTFPIAMGIAVWLKHGVVRRRDLVALLPHAVVLALLAVFDVTRAARVAPSDFGLSVVDRGLVASRAAAFYAAKLAWPEPLMPVYPRWGPGEAASWAAAVVLIAGALALFALRRRIGRGPLAALLFFLVTLSPMSGFVDFGWMRYSFVADRFQYLASAGPCLLVAAGAARLGRRARLPGVLVLVVLGALTFRHASIWQDDERFFRHVVTRNPAATDGWFNLGAGLVAKPGRIDDAIAAFEEAAARDPRSAKVRYNLGTALATRGLFAEAVPHLEETLRIDPSYPDAHGNLGIALAGLGRLDEAEAAFRRALELEPGDPRAKANLARIQARIGAAR